MTWRRFLNQFSIVFPAILVLMILFWNSQWLERLTGLSFIGELAFFFFAAIVLYLNVMLVSTLVSKMNAGRKSAEGPLE